MRAETSGGKRAGVTTTGDRAQNLRDGGERGYVGLGILSHRQRECHHTI